MAWTVWLVVGVVALAGVGASLQALVNAELARRVGPVEAVLVSALITVGTLALLMALGVRSGRLGAVMGVPPYLLIGGILGASILLSTVWAVPRVGTATFVSAIVVGQLVGALLLDHFGVLGAPRIPITWVRVVGVVLLLAGMRLVVR